MKEEICLAWGTIGQNDKLIYLFVRKHLGSDYLGYISIDEKTLLEWILKRECIGVIWIQLVQNKVKWRALKEKAE
jgi:hypothetical protein